MYHPAAYWQPTYQTAYWYYYNRTSSIDSMYSYVLFMYHSGGSSTGTVLFSILLVVVQVHLYEYKKNFSVS